MKVKEFMTKNVEIANPEMSLLVAAQKMRDGNFGILPVGENDRLMGMITDRDIAIRAVAEGKDPNQTKIRDVMSTKGVLYCFEDEDIDEVALNLKQNKIRRLPVLNTEKRLVGILSMSDLTQEGQLGQSV